jgi:hypothetical protein
MDQANDPIAAYLQVVKNDDEKDKYFRNRTKQQLMDLVEAFKEEREQTRADLTMLRQSQHDKQAELLNKQGEVNDKEMEIRNSQAESDNKTHEINTLNDKLANVKTEVLTRDDTINGLKMKMQAELVAKKTVTQDLVRVRHLLEKKEQLVADLMNRLDKKMSGDSDSGEEDDFAKMVLFIEKDMEGILDDINIKGYWDKYTGLSGVDDLRGMIEDDNHRNKIHNYDKAVLVVGLNDIKKGADGFTIGKKLAKCVTKIKALELDVAIVQLPPADNHSMPYDMFNCKIESIEGVEIINISQQTDMMTLDQIIKDGKPTSSILTIMAKAINEQVKFPDKKSKSKITLKPEQSLPETSKPLRHQNIQSETDLMIKEIFPIEKAYTGLVIGKVGKTIQKITEDTDTDIRIVDEEAFGDGTKMVHIKGLESCVLLAKKKIDDLIKGAKEKEKVREKRSIDKSDTQAKKRKF